MLTVNKLCKVADVFKLLGQTLTVRKKLNSQKDLDALAFLVINWLMSFNLMLKSTKFCM